VAKPKAPMYQIRVVSDPAEAVPGALRVGPPDDPNRWCFGSYTHYWNEVEALRDHRRKLEEYELEAADARPSLAAFFRQRVADHAEFIAMLAATPPQVAETYRALHDLGVLMHGYNANVSEGRGGQQPGLTVGYGRERRVAAHEQALSAVGG